MIYPVGIEDIEPDHFIAWAFARPGLTGSGKNPDAAIAHLQNLLSNSEVRVAEIFKSYMSKDQPDYRINAFFEDDKRPLNAAEINMALDEMLISRREFLEQIERAAPDVLARSIPGEDFESINGIIKHVAVAEWYYCHKLDDGKDKFALEKVEPLEALTISRENTRHLLPALAGDTRIVEFLEEKWSARKILRRTLWHERDHTRHIAQRLRELNSGLS